MNGAASVLAFLVATSLGLPIWGQTGAPAQASSATAAGLSVALANGAKTGPSATKAVELPAVDECGWTGSSATRLVRPKSLLVMCGDGNGGLKDLGWTSWGSQEAFARGVYTWNTCVPACAAPNSKWDNTAATVALSDPLPTPQGPLFGLLRVHVIKPTRDSPPSETIVYVPTEVACDRTNRGWARKHHVLCGSL